MGPWGNKMTKQQAYDIARKEFYAIRHAEEISQRMAREEAEYVGAYWGKNILEVGMELEDKVYEKWKVWANLEIAQAELQRDSAYTGIGTANDDGPETDPMDEVNGVAKAAEGEVES